MNVRLIVISLVCLAHSANALAQRRGEQVAAASTLRLTLDAAYRFGDVQVRAGDYRVAIRDGVLGLADAATMVPVATITISEAKTEGWVEPSRLQLEKNGARLTIRVHSHDRVYEARGQKTEIAPRKKPDVALANKQDVALDYQGPDRETAREQIARAMKRYERGVKHCADKAKRAQWQTDDPRFHKCICPATSKWRLPKQTPPLRYHHLLGKRRTGLSFTVTKDGKVRECRVWSGSEPPADEKVPAAANKKAAK